MKIKKLKEWLNKHNEDIEISIIVKQLEEHTAGCFGESRCYCAEKDVEYHIEGLEVGKNKKVFLRGGE